MSKTFDKVTAEETRLEQRYRELRRTMQEIVIAHAAACYKHMNREQLDAVQAEWARLIKGKKWEAFFADEGPPPATQRWSPPVEVE